MGGKDKGDGSDKGGGNDKGGGGGNDKVIVHADGSLTVAATNKKIYPAIPPEGVGSKTNAHGYKVLLCHVPPGNPDNAHTIEIDIHAVQTHLDHHGDYFGPCQSGKGKDKGKYDPGDIIKDPATLAEGESFPYWRPPLRSTGIVYQRSGIKTAHIFDGTSNTYLLGEKYMDANHYGTGKDPGDNHNMFVGFSHDNHRWTKPELGMPMRDRSGVSNPNVFGSAHSAGWHVVFADGSVHMMSYHLSEDIHKYLGNRRDGNRIPQDKY